MKCLAAPGANQQMQVRAHVRKIVDPYSETMGHRSKSLAYGGLVFAKRPEAPSSLAREDDMHGAPHADGTLELATMASEGATVFGSHEIGTHVAAE